MFAAKLDRLITLQLKVESKNSIGELSVDWVTTGTTYATVTPAGSGYKFTQGSIDTNIGKTQFFIRWQNLNYNYRIVYNGEVYRIEDLQEVGRKEALKIIATSKQSE